MRFLNLFLPSSAGNAGSHGRQRLRPLHTWVGHIAAHRLQYGIIVVVLLAAILLPVRVATGHQLPALFFLLYLAAAAAVFLLRFPHLGIAGLTIIGLVVPFTIGTGAQTGINASVLVLTPLIGLWLLTMLTERRPTLLHTRPILPLLVFIASALISYGFGQLNWLPIQAASERAQLAGVAVFVLSAGAFLLVAHQVRRQYMLEQITWVFLAAGAVYILGRLLPQAYQFTTAHFLPEATGGASLFWTWLVALAFSQAVFNRSLRKLWRFGLAMLVLGTFYVSFGEARAWTSGWLPSVVAVMISVAAAKPKRALPMLLGVLVLLLADRQTINGLLLVGDNAYSLTTRVEALQVLLGLIKLSPIFGLGPANYYWYASLFPISGYYVPFNSHNNYVDLVAQVGLVGLACFVWFVVEIGRLGWQLRRQMPDGFAKAYCYGALGGLAGTLVAGALGDWILPFIYNIGLNGFRASILAWLFLGGLVALHGIYGLSGSTAHERGVEPSETPRSMTAEVSS